MVYYFVFVESRSWLVRIGADLLGPGHWLAIQVLSLRRVFVYRLGRFEGGRVADLMGSATQRPQSLLDWHRFEVIREHRRLSLTKKGLRGRTLDFENLSISYCGVIGFRYIYRTSTWIGDFRSWIVPYMKAISAIPIPTVGAFANHDDVFTVFGNFDTDKSILLELGSVVSCLSMIAGSLKTVGLSTLCVSLKEKRWPT